MKKLSSVCRYRSKFCCFVGSSRSLVANRKRKLKQKGKLLTEIFFWLSIFHWMNSKRCTKDRISIFCYLLAHSGASARAQLPFSSRAADEMKWKRMRPLTMAFLNGCQFSNSKILVDDPAQLASAKLFPIISYLLEFIFLRVIRMLFDNHGISYYVYNLSVCEAVD